ncbi:MAG: stage V sporulation protein D [Candidatus Omnitrophica bacterium]|nr:stage V sporulation protein D [Candidatus Omnitrophota bacterium]
MTWKTKYRYKRPRKIRFFVILFFFAVSFVVLLGHLFSIQIVQHERYAEIASQNRTASIKYPPNRGLILDRNYNELAINIPKNSIYAIPRYIEDKDKTATRLAPILGVKEEYVLRRISTDKLFVWIERKADDNIIEAVRAGNLEGLEFMLENERAYPNNSLCSHVIGFVDVDNRGLEGIERFYDRELRGTEGYRIVTVDAKRRQVDSDKALFLPPQDGFNIVLTIDHVVQHIVETAMKKCITKHHPKSASTIVMDPENGEVLALFNWPDFDINNCSVSSPGEIRNRAVTDIFEPGSSFKIVTASAALEEQIVDMDDEFDCENGSYKIANRVLHDHRKHGILSFKNIIEVSSNIGTVKVAEKLGPDKLYKYIDLFGFGKNTGIDLPGEVSGIARKPGEWTEGSIAALPIGQEIAVTAIQMVDAIACIANDGIRVQPHLLKRVTDKNGVVIREYNPKLVKRVISTETCAKVKDILKMVVESGTGQRARLKSYSTAGKTGTAQRLEENGSYSHTKFNSVFVGFAPADEPRIAVCVLLVEPYPQYYGGTVAAPVFSEITDRALRHLGVRPNDF